MHLPGEWVFDLLDAIATDGASDVVELWIEMCCNATNRTKRTI